ncbi:MAG: DUF2523 family protein [Methylococcales bacterium]|nr:DUF2523 family protein [Methylococcales bacterium]
MSLIKIPLGSFLQSAVGSLAKRVLVSLGFGIISFASIAAALNAALGYAQTAYSGLPAFAAAFLGLAGVGYGLGIVAAALVFRASYLALPRLGSLIK